ncbi:hypothetical protein LCGC14_1503490 [marine sediment metagenome]|uniref:Uncharacterized protein n=1 Tax=marine sediment metagenome TaxID=412755 RepID=A0A0F9M4S7_9ZZZZ
MPYGDIKTLFVMTTGRSDLVATGNLWKLAYFINAGQRWLDRKAIKRDQLQRYMRDVAAGQKLVELSDVRLIKTVFIVDGQGDESELERFDPLDFKMKYANIDDEDTGTPIDFCINISRDQGLVIGVAVTESVNVGDFATDTKWTKGTGWAIAAGVAVKTGTNWSELSQVTGDQNEAILDGSPYRVQYTVTGLTDGDFIRVRLGETYGQRRETNGTFIEDIVARGTTPSIVFDGAADGFAVTLDNVSVKKSTYANAGRTVAEGGYQSWPAHMLRRHFDSIALGPVPDSTYTLEVIGRFYEPRVIGDWDSTYWTEEEPNLLVWAAAYIMEITYRNSEGADDWEAKIDKFLGDIERDKVAEEVVGINKMKG